MAVLDWIIVGIYLLVSIAVGVYFTKRAVRSTSDYFVAGRSLGWFIAGTSIVATTFSSDTPLLVAGLTRQAGISGHWFWWSAAIGQIATIFFFARLWRRTEAMTDIEFVVIRYAPSRARSVLRVFKVFFDGVLINCIVTASVTLAMVKIIKAMMNLPDVTLFRVPFVGEVGWAGVLMVVLGVSSVFYTALAGLYGVVYTDLIQFILAMAGCIMMAIIVYADAAAGAGGMMGTLAKAAEFRPEMLRFYPDLSSFDLKTFTFFVYIFVVWWYRAPANGYYVQRILGTRSEKESVLAFLWFNIIQYVIRSWPWIIVGLLSLYYLPNLKDAESSFPLMINLFLPVGLKGIMVASMLAAYMSTVVTHFNLGASYIINDFYQPFINPHKSARHYVIVSQLGTLFIAVVILVFCTRLTSILGAYKYLAVMFGGIGTVMIARWYWWRVNAYSEIAAIMTSFVVGNFVEWRLRDSDGGDLFGVRVVITVFAVTAVWVMVTFLTSPETPDEHTVAFYKKMRISGWGWRKVAKLAKAEPIAGEFGQNLLGWLSCVVFIFSLMIGVGKFILQEFRAGFVYLLVAAVGGYMLRRVVRKMRF